nr:hypothetical protein [Tanacetum cinerariifolium]
MDKGKGQISEADDESFIEVKRKKLDSNYGGNKHFKPVSVKPKTQYRPKANQSTVGTCNSFKMAPLAGTNKVSTSSCNKESPRNKGNGSFYVSNSFEALIVDDPIIDEVATGKLVLVDDDGKPVEKVDDEAELVENETASFFLH